jgi:PIN domain nuclease of toxin-antitoxin system
MSQPLSRYVLDAHALIWYLEGNSRLGAGARSVLANPQSELFLPIIALAEACWIVEHGRSRIPSVDDLLTHVDADPRMVLVPLDRAILDISITLTAINEMHDRLIIATTLQLAEVEAEIALLTRDVNIRASNLVPIVWE